MAKKQNETEILFATEPVSVNGKKVLVKPYSWAGAVMMAKPLAVIIKAVIANIDAIDQGLKSLKSSTDIKKTSETSIDETAEGKKKLIDQIMIITDLIERVKNPEEIIDALSELVAASTDLDPSEVRELLPDEMYEISQAVYKVNKAFFDKRLVPMMKKNPGGKQEK